MSQEWEKIKALKRDHGIGGPGQRRSYEKPKNIRKTVSRLLNDLARNRWLLFLAIFFIVVSSIGSIAGTWYLKPLINRLTTGSDMRSMIGSLVQMAVIYIFAAVTSYVSSLIMVHLAQKTTHRIRTDLFSHMQDLPLNFFDSRTHGELMSRYTNDVDNVNMALEQSLSQTISSAIAVVGTFIMMLILSPFLTIFVVIMLVIMLYIIRAVGQRSNRYFRTQQKSLGELNGLVEEMMKGQKVVKVFNYEDQAKAIFTARNEALRQTSTDAQTFAGILMPIMGNLSYAHYAITAMAGALLAIQGTMDIGTIAAYLQYTRSFSMPITQIANQFNSLLAALAGAERIFEVLDQKAETDEGKVRLIRSKKVHEQDESTWFWLVPEATGDRMVPLHGDVRFQDVIFGYTPEKEVLKKINLFAKPGQKIAFVGSTGAGKTTITNLINRFYEIQEGKITYDGIDIRDIRKDDLRRALGMVLQDVHLFQGTIRDNIRYGKLDATDEDIIKAAQIANAHSFIMKLPEGYDTILAPDGANLSQGQRQLLSIARAAVADPPVLILDEATSSIDTRTERLIEKGMDQLMHGRTTLAIAHRLSTVRLANAIMVLENGEIIERGDHDDLLDLRGKYYQLSTGITELS